MLRNLISNALRTTCRAPAALSLNTQRAACYTQLVQNGRPLQNTIIGNSMLTATTLTHAASLKLLQLPITAAGIVSQMQPTRSVTKFSLIKGKRKSVKAVLKRFKRLDWGAWIRTHSGRHKKLFKKSPALQRRLRQHVFTNATQSWLLDKMVTSFWRRPKYYIDDPYTPYHRRSEYFATKSRKV